MKALAQPEIYDVFLRKLESCANRVLLLDYDGTLAPFQTDRSRAFPYPEVSSLLGHIAECGTRVVLITGRAAKDLLPLTAIHPAPEIWGSHGLERLTPDGSYQITGLSDEQRTGMRHAAEVLARHHLADHMETKPGGVAVHWRGLPTLQVDALKHRVLQLWAPLLALYSLDLLQFDGGIELRGSQADKGKAVAAILSETGPDAAIAYLGDDQTDEDAFRVLNGKGLTALVRPEYRQTAAQLWLQPPGELIQFLKDWLGSCGGEA